MTKKVAIIGGGISGLVTAFYLKKAGIDFTIFEKQERFSAGQTALQFYDDQGLV